MILVYLVVLLQKARALMERDLRAQRAADGTELHAVSAANKLADDNDDDDALGTAMLAGSDAAGGAAGAQEPGDDDDDTVLHVVDSGMCVCVTVCV